MLVLLLLITFFICQCWWACYQIWCNVCSVTH